MKTNHNRGFIALMSVIIISMLLLTFVVTLGASAYFTRFDALDLENKRTSLDLAETCGRAALARIAQNNSYTPASAGDCVSAGDVCGVKSATHTCKICQVSSSGNSYTIFTRAVYQRAYTNLEVGATFDAHGLTVTEWKQAVANTVPTCTVP